MLGASNKDWALAFCISLMRQKPPLSSNWIAFESEWEDKCNHMHEQNHYKLPQVAKTCMYFKVNCKITIDFVQWRPQGEGGISFRNWKKVVKIVLFPGLYKMVKFRGNRNKKRRKNQLSIHFFLCKLKFIVKFTS